MDGEKTKWNTNRKKKKRSQIIFQRNSKTTLRGKKLTKQNLIAEF